jgi:serine/threonine protein kinase/Tfp pilus assembly protein PilF
MMIGQTISHYKIIEKLGEGGMGKVYLAEDLQLKRKVALKFLPHELIRDAETRTRFIYEAQAASALDHPNIATIFEINEREEDPFIAMAYYPGGTLSDKIKQKELTIEQTIKITICIAEGLQKAHDKNIVHRDIKPANILFSENGEAKIIDFGLAKLLGQSVLSRTGTTVGTIAYMSPEQAMGKKIDQRTDIWALGVILYEMLAGEHPFKGDYEQALMYSIVNEEPEFISKIRTDVPLEVEKIIEQALSKNPQKRFQSMHELWQALEQAAANIQLGKSKTASVYRLGRRQRKFVLRSLPVVFVLLTILVYFALLKDLFASPVSIVLLPLENISRDAEQEWFTEGMTDALITDLARINNLRIISRSSAMKYKGSKKSAAEIAAELGVSYVIEGSVVKAEDLVKISVRLIDAASDEYAWAQEYERDFKDIFSLQGEVAQAIARQIQVNLTPGEKTYLSEKRQVNPEAHEAYLKGNFYLYKLTRRDIETALQYFELAAKLDPGYALAHAGIALAKTVPAQMGYMSMREAYGNAKPAIEKTMELDDSLPEVHYMRGVFAAWYEWNWDLALSSFEKTIRLNPNMATARAYYSHLLFTLKRPEEGLEQITRALKLDPFNQLFCGLYAMDLNYLHRYEEAIEGLKQTLENSPQDPIALSTLRTTYHQKKMYPEAIDIWRRSYAAGNDQVSLEALNHGYQEGGYALALRRVAESKIRQSQEKYVSPWQIATLYTRAGMPDEALDWLEKALEVRDPNMPYLSVDPIFDYMRADPRFQILLNKVGL